MYFIRLRMFPFIPNLPRVVVVCWFIMGTVLSRSVVSSSLQRMACSHPGFSAHGDSPGKNTGVSCHALLQGIFPTQGSNPGLPCCRQMFYHLSHRGRLRSNQSFLKGNQHWLFTGRIDAEAEAPILWSPDEKSRLIRKDPDSGRIEGRRRRGWQGMRWLDSITKPIQWTWTWEISGR